MTICSLSLYQSNTATFRKSKQNDYEVGSVPLLKRSPLQLLALQRKHEHPPNKTRVNLGPEGNTPTDYTQTRVNGNTS